MKWKPATLCTLFSAEVVGAHWGLSPHTSGQGKGINRLKLWLQKEVLLRYLEQLDAKGHEFLLSSSQQELGRRQQIHVVEGAIQPLWGQALQILQVISVLSRALPRPGPLSEGGQHTGEGSLGECNDNSSPGPTFVRGNKKITSENKYYLGYWLKKGKLMPRHHA